MAVEAGAGMRMMENRFVPTQFKDGYGPVHRIVPGFELLKT